MVFKTTVKNEIVGAVVCEKKGKEKIFSALKIQKSFNPN